MGETQPDQKENDPREEGAPPRRDSRDGYAAAGESGGDAGKAREARGNTDPRDAGVGA